MFREHSTLKTGALVNNFRAQSGTWFMKDANIKLIHHMKVQKKKYSKLLCAFYFNLSLELRNVSLLDALKSWSEM